MKTLLQLITIILLASCSVSYVSEGEKQREELHHVTSIHRNIVGYDTGLIFKNRIYYKVTDSRGRPAPRIYEPDIDSLKPVGYIWIFKENEFFEN